MPGKPSKRLGAGALHRNLGHQVFEVKIEVTNPAVGQNNVCIQNFAGRWMHAAWANRGSNIIVQPTNEVVANVLGVFLHVSLDARRRILVFDNDRIDQTNFLERFVPIVNAGFDPTSITHWCGVFDKKPNGFFRWA